jgi:hypothetical protein
MFTLESKSFRLALQVVPVAALLQHEETLSGPVRKLTLALKNQAHLHDPIIIDANNVVLDGNHRAFVFKTLKFKHIAACRIDYFHDETKLRYWYRRLTHAPDLNLIKGMVEAAKGRWQTHAHKDSLQKALEESPLCCGIQLGDAFASVRFQGDMVHDAVSAYDIFNRIQEWLVKEGAALEYIPCNRVHETDFCRELDPREVVLWSPRISKEMVIDAARRKKIFTPKATRHLIPARPLNVNVPTQWFREDVSLQEVNLRFAEHLKRKQIQHLGPGQILNGRYYEEELFVFLEESIP